ncbi:MAG: alpha/beta hydrolase [Rhodospirillales bacterium]|nr:alpha/beta hydrolase [Rhodospirillales bacterium]
MTENPDPDILTRSDGATIAYHLSTGKPPGVVFLTGYNSDMTGSKALHLEEYCRRRGQAFLRFDYTGHGQSSGKFIDGTIGQWTEDAIFAIETLTEGPQILIGSSMGGWIMLRAALKLNARVAGLLGIAAAPDFTEDLLENQLSPEQRSVMERDGVIYMTSEYEPEPMPFTQALIEDGRKHLLLRGPIALDCPVRLIQGMKDEDVPWQTALRISERLQSEDVEIIFVKNGGHRLSEDADLARLTRTLESLLQESNAS